jgi:hypothetical protein
MAERHDSSQKKCTGISVSEPCIELLFETLDLTWVEVFVDHFIISLEQDGLFKEGKLHVYYGDTVTWVKGRPRTKIVFNNRNMAEAKGLSDQQVWGIRGLGVTLVRAGKKHYGLVFFDDSPTARVTKIAAPMNDDLHEELADRLVSRF